ncbi:MAG TPA: zf-HC2 domain-containing protein [Gammaproteobacteria bacterium]
MSCEDTIALVADRLMGLISPEDETRLDAHLAGCAACRAEAETMTAVWDDLGSLEVDVPHERMRARFHAALAAVEQRPRRGAFETLLERFWPARPAWQLGVALSLLVAGVVVGRTSALGTAAEIAALREEIRMVGLALLDHQSASERLLGVAWARRAAPAPQVIQALVERVEYDPNLNVRLAAVDALRAEAAMPEVGAALAMALEHEEAPLMQVALADALLETGGADGIEAVRRLLTRDRLDPAVRDFLVTALRDVGAEVTPPPDA